MRPDQVVQLAAQMRRVHYARLGATSSPWHSLTDAQKLPWLIKASGR